MVEVIRAFCWHQKFVPKGFSAFAPGLYTCIKSFAMCLKSYFKEIVLKLATNGQSDKGFLLTTFVPKGLSAPALWLYTFTKSLKYIPGPGVRWALVMENWRKLSLNYTQIPFLSVPLTYRKTHYMNTHIHKQKLNNLNGRALSSQNEVILMLECVMGPNEDEDKVPTER